MTTIAMNDFLSQEAKRDPHAFYAQLPADEPLHYVEGLNAWLVTSYEDALFVLKDPRFIKDRAKLESPEEAQYLLPELMPFMKNMLMVDPPDYERLRHLVSKAFTPRMIERLRSRIQQIADVGAGHRLESHQPAARVDALRRLGFHHGAIGAGERQTRTRPETGRRSQQRFPQVAIAFAQ